MDRIFPGNTCPRNILWNCLSAAVSLFLNGFGVYLTIHAAIGASPWDVLNLGLSNTFGILYGTASIVVSLVILCIDIAMGQPIGIAMFIDAIVVGKSVDFFRWLHLLPAPSNLFFSLVLMFVGLTIMGYTQYSYMRAALGCGPRDTLLVGLTQRLKGIPIGAVSIGLLSLATLSGYLLGGPVGIGTIVCALCAGPIMQLAFRSMHFDATGISHQRLGESARILMRRR